MKRKLLALFLCSVLLFTGCSANKLVDNQVTKQAASKSDDNYESANIDNYDNSENDAISDEVNESSSQTSEPVNTDQKLVYTCDLTIETLEYSKTLSSVKELIKKYGGILEEENESDSNSSWYYDRSKKSGTLHNYLTIRIPSEKYNSFLNDLDGQGKVTSKSMRTENITKQYSDVETTIKSLKTQEERLLDMMKQAKTVDDMITVETRLTEVQNTLEQYKNTLESYKTDIRYSTVHLSIDEVVKYEARL